MTRYTVRIHKISDDRASVTVTPADIYDFEEGKVEAVGRKIFTVQTEAENPVWAQQQASEYLSEYFGYTGGKKHADNTKENRRY